MRFKGFILRAYLRKTTATVIDFLKSTNTIYWGECKRA